MNKKISIVIPVYCESAVIKMLTDRIIKALKKDFNKLDYEILFVDDGSSDSTFQIIEELHKDNKNIKAVGFSRNFGHHIALTAGIDYSTGDYVVIMDGDLQDLPEEIITLYNKLCEGYDIVYAQRINSSFNNYKKITSGLFDLILKKLIPANIQIEGRVFRIMKKDVVDNIKLLREQDRYIVGIIGWVGYKHIGIPIKHGRRPAGETKYSFTKSLSLSIDAILSFSLVPLREFALFCFYLSLTILIIGTISIITFIVRSNFKIEFIAIYIIILLACFQLALLSLIGEYAGRIYFQGKKRPLYIVKSVLK